MLWVVSTALQRPAPALGSQQQRAAGPSAVPTPQAPLCRQRRRAAAVRAAPEQGAQTARWGSDLGATCRVLPYPPTAAPSNSIATHDADLDQQLQQDLERLRQRQAAAGGAAPAGPAGARQPPSSAEQAGGGALGGLKEAVDKVGRWPCSEGQLCGVQVVAPIAAPASPNRSDGCRTVSN